MRSRYIISALLLVPFALFAFSLTARNTLEYRAAEADKGNSFFEDRLDLRLNHSDIIIGLTYEAMQPSRESALTRPDSTYTAITQRWARFQQEYFDITGGTFMATLGNGLLIDARERRDVQQDHHLDGAKVTARAYNFDMTMLAGLAAWDDNTRFMAAEINSYHKYAPIGGGYIRYDVDGGELLPGLIGETYEIHATPSAGSVNGYFRYAKTWRGPEGGGVEFQGNATYGSVSTFFGPVTLFGEFITVDSFIVKGYGDENSQYITLPLIVRQPSYTLMSRHLATINPREATAFSGEIGLFPVLDGEMTASFAMIDHSEEANDYTEGYLELYRDWEKLTMKGIYEMQITGEDDPTHNLVLEPLYYFTDRASLLLDLEFQTGTEFDETATNLYGLMEFTLSPYGAIGMEGGTIQEWDSETSSLEPENFVRFYIDGEIAKNHKLTLAYGKRPGGFTCSGGTCRMEPQFEGFELKLSSSF